MYAPYWYSSINLNVKGSAETTKEYSSLNSFWKFVLNRIIVFFRLPCAGFRTFFSPPYRKKKFRTVTDLRALRFILFALILDLFLIFFLFLYNFLSSLSYFKTCFVASDVHCALMEIYQCIFVDVYIIIVHLASHIASHLCPAFSDVANFRLFGLQYISSFHLFY